MADQPLAYFITFSTYGTWLHGEAAGSVDAAHNAPGTPLLPADTGRRAAERQDMAQPPYVLDDVRRSLVRDAIVEECRFRGWRLLALHVRTNHVHVVVTADREPEFVLRACKAHASRCLNQAGVDAGERKRCTVHGSTRYLWTMDAVREKVEYTLRGQGEPLAYYEGDGQELDGGLR